MTTKEREEILFQFIGYGIPDSPIWFMSIEESKPFDNLDDNILSIYRQKTYMNGNLLVTSSGNNKTYVEPRINNVYGKYKSILGNVDFFDGYYNEGRYFFLNLWPWGKEKERKDISTEEKNYFGFNELSLYEIKEKYKNIRFLYLKHFFRTFHWKEKYIFFCFGKSNLEYTNEFISDLYGENINNVFTDYQKKYNIDCDVFKVENNKRFILPCASWNKINNKIIEKLNEIIR